MPSLRSNLGEHPIYTFTCGDALRDGLQVGAKMARSECRKGLADDLACG